MLSSTHTLCFVDAFTRAFVLLAFLTPFYSVVNELLTLFSLLMLLMHYCCSRFALYFAHAFISCYCYLLTLTLTLFSLLLLISRLLCYSMLLCYCLSLTLSLCSIAYYRRLFSRSRPYYCFAHALMSCYCSRFDLLIIIDVFISCYCLHFTHALCYFITMPMPLSLLLLYYLMLIVSCNCIFHLFNIRHLLFFLYSHALTTNPRE